jgi:hypothetical protein
MSYAKVMYVIRDQTHAKHGNYANIEADKHEWNTINVNKLCKHCTISTLILIYLAIHAQQHISEWDICTLILITSLYCISDTIITKSCQGGRTHRNRLVIFSSIVKMPELKSFKTTNMDFAINKKKL